MSAFRVTSVAERARTTVVFLVTFVTSWLLLDRLVTAPPLPVPAATALVAAACATALGLRASGTPWERVPFSLGLGAPAPSAMVRAAVVGGIFVVTVLLAAAAADVHLTLRESWSAVLVGVLLFHGMAEEVVWRGYVYGRLRQTRTFVSAVWWSVPLIALTHTPIVVTDGWLVGGLATLTAATTCWPLAFLWERGGRTVWAPAVLHALIGTWQLLERPHPPAFSLIVLVASICVPLLVFLPARSASHGAPSDHPSRAPATIPTPAQPNRRIR